MSEKISLDSSVDNENTLNSDILKATYYARTRPVNFLGFTNLPGQPPNPLYYSWWKDSLSAVIAL